MNVRKRLIGKRGIVGGGQDIVKERVTRVTGIPYVCTCMKLKRNIREVTKIYRTKITFT